MQSDTELDREELAGDEAARELILREKVIAVLEGKKTRAGNDAEVGKLIRLIENIEAGSAGWDKQHGIKGIISEIKRQDTRIERAQRQHDAQMGIDELIREYNFHIKSTGSGGWWYQQLTPNEFGVRAWASVKKEALLMSFPQLNVKINMGEGVERYDALQDFNIKLVQQGRRVESVVMSHTTRPNTLNIMPTERRAGAEDGATNYHWIFDAIMESLSGGHINSDQFDAFQKTIWSKYLHPENVYLPHISICDEIGRGGKGLFANNFLRHLFMGNIADNCNIGHVIGKFNAVVAGKAIIVVNETNRDKMEHESTKAFLGSPTIIVEPKGMDPYPADNTGMVFFLTNESTGGVNVSGTKSDNRFSFFNVKETIYAACGRWIEATTGEKWTELQIKQWIESRAMDSGQNLLRDEYEMGKWINAMQEKWGDVVHVEPFHDLEYERIIDAQRGAWTQTVEQVFEDTNFEYIRWEVLERLIRHYNPGERLPGKKNMKREILRLIQDRNYDIEFVERAQIRDGTKIVQRTVFRRYGKTLCTGGEAHYGFLEAHSNRWIWVWEV